MLRPIAPLRPLAGLRTLAPLRPLAASDAPFQAEALRNVDPSGSEDDDPVDEMIADFLEEF